MMMLSIFSGFYELISGANPDVPDYSDEVYETVGQITIVVVVAFDVLFYVFLGRWKPVFHKRTHWVTTLLLLMSIALGIAFLTAKDVIGEVDSYMYRFSIMNAVFAGVLFIILSLLFRRISIFAKKTPF
jgi:hypothetical protein